MTTLPHEPPAAAEQPWWVDARDMWSSLAIMAIWVAVALTAVFGPDFKTVDAAGNSTVIPSGILVALFALFATMAVAKYGFAKKADN